MAGQTVRNSTKGTHLSILGVDFKRTEHAAVLVGLHKLALPCLCAVRAQAAVVAQRQQQSPVPHKAYECHSVVVQAAHKTARQANIESASNSHVLHMAQRTRRRVFLKCLPLCAYQTVWDFKGEAGTLLSATQKHSRGDRRGRALAGDAAETFGQLVVYFEGQALVGAAGQREVQGLSDELKW